MPRRMRSRERARSTSRCSDIRVVPSEERAQATVEAAALVPVICILLLLSLQPVCLLYTRSVMESAAAATARLMVTGDTSDEDAHRAFALRRLAAVPDVSIFHAGGPLAWQIDLTYAHEADGVARVQIEGAAQPLPLMGALVGATDEINGQGDVVLQVEVSYEGEPSWVEGSYETWIEAWG